MSRGSAKPALSIEDRILWAKVARSATPLRGKSHPHEPAPRPGEEAKAEFGAPPAVPPAEGPAGKIARSGSGAALRTIDAPTREKLAKGRLAIEARVDLHGMRQREAHALLLSFIARAHARGIRNVLVITGKGASIGSDGVLRNSVPAWLSTEPFRAYVGGLDQAARQHGGQGAYYVRLRRTRSPPA